MQIYNGQLSDVSNIESNTFLQVNNCGIQFQSGQGKLTYRKEGRCDYHIILITDGTCEAEYDGQTSLIHYGFILYPPHMSQRYIEHTGTKKLWLHFNGHYVEEILKEARLTYGVHALSRSSICEKIFLQLISEHNQKTDISNEKGLLLTLLSTLGKSIHSGGSSNSKIEETISFITTHYNTEISIQELADSCGLSQSRFMHVFKEKTGQSPHAYQQMLRINNCMTLLASTQLSVMDVGALNGYTDPLYFSRIFKKHVGMSPKEYRKREGHHE